MALVGLFLVFNHPIHERNQIMKSITIDGVEYVPKRELKEPTGNYCIVRCRNAGVHAGYVESRKDGVLRLRDSRRLWRWWSKFSLSGLATDGPLESKIEEQRYACVLPLIELTESDVCEVIPCSDAAAKAIQEVPEHTNE